jgi:hypothetical protein
MDAWQAKHVKRAAPVWVWDGHWWPAVVKYAGRGGGSLIVRLENGVTVPVSMDKLRPRDPALRGSDKPKRHLRMAN